MIHVHRMFSSLRGERARVFELAGVTFLWHAAVGVYFLSLVQQYLPHELNAGRAYPGYAMACYGGVRFVWQPVAGWLADRLGSRVMMIAGMAFSVPVLALMMQIPDARVFLVLSACLGIAFATMAPAFMAYVGETTPRSRRTRTMSMLHVSHLAGLGIGTVVGVMAVDFITYSAAFWICIAFSALALVLVLRAADAKTIPWDAQPADGEPVQEKRRDPGAWRPGIPMLAVIVLFLTLGTSMHTPMIGAYTKEVLNVRMSYMAMLLPAPVLVAAFVFWRFNRFADRYGREVPLIVGLLVAAMAIFALTQTRSPIIVVNLAVLAGLAYAISLPAWGAAALDATDVGSRGLWLGALAAVQGLGTAGGQALGGLVGAEWGTLAPFKIAAIALLIALVLTVGNQKIHTHRAKRAAVPIRASD